MADQLGTITPENPPTEEIDLDKVLNWNPETDGELPEQYRTLTPEQVKDHVTKATEAAATAERERALQAEHQRQASAQAETERRAALQSDIDWANDLRARLTSDDEAVRRQAQLEEQNGSERFARGLAARHQASEEAVQQRVLAGHYTPLIDGLNAAGYTGFTSSISDRLQQASNNPLIAAIEFGKELGDAAGRAALTEEFERNGRIEKGKNGAPDMGNGNAATGREDYGDPGWVKAQMDGDPEWALAKSADGKLSNLQRATSAGALVRAQEQMRAAPR